jgi:hypothetical protein
VIGEEEAAEPDACRDRCECDENVIKFIDYLYDKVGLKWHMHHKDVEKDFVSLDEEDIRDYHRWKIHYCATFFELGHPYICLSVFQSFNTVYHVEPTDVVTHQWTILRVLN